MTADDHLLLVDKNLLVIPHDHLHKSLKTVNLHCNNIVQITGFGNCRNLTSLDLSCNKLTSISGLDGLCSLSVLNMSSNFITKVEGVGNLLNLKYVNLSYNRITSLDGFHDLQGSKSHLKVIVLHKNNLSCLQHLTHCLRGIVSLEHLVMQQETHSNPIVNVINYRDKILSALPQLSSLDCWDRDNRLVDITSTTYSFDCDTRAANQVTAKELMPLMNTAHLFPVSTPQSIAGKLISTPVDCKPVKVQSENIKEVTDIYDQSLSITPSSPKAPKINNKKPATVTKYSSSKNHGRTVRKLSFKHLNSSIDKQSYINLLKELEEERERRWKSEEACKRLSKVVQEIQVKDGESRSLLAVAAATADRLKQTLIVVKQNNDTLEAENREKSGTLSTLRNDLLKTNERAIILENNLRSALTNTKDQLSTLQAKRANELAEAESRLCHLNSKYNSACLRNKQLAVKLENLQEMFICQEKIKSVNVSAVADLEFRSALKSEMEKNEEQHRVQVEELERKLVSLKSEYTKLEEEFREGLLIESQRYNAIQNQCSVATKRAQNVEALLNSASEKEGKYCAMINEMTCIIKEQKVKIVELLKSKEDVSKHFQKQLESLQQESLINLKKVQQLEVLKQENAQLKSKFSAMQTLTDRLKEERKLWSMELAEQGSSLAKDRGRLEMKIESLKAEVSSLRKNNERDLDCLRIKSKVVEDQTETILKMKEALAAKDKEIRSRLDEQLAEQQLLHDQVDELTQENASLQSDNAKLVERKQQLKNEVSNCNAKYETLLVEHKEQKRRWIEKSSLLSVLEQQVKNASEAHRQKEEKTTREKDAALNDLLVMKNKNEELAAAYRKQMQAVTALHEQELHLLNRDKQQEINQMKTKVACVEEEMIELLKENQKKKAMEVKIEKMKTLFEETV